MNLFNNYLDTLKSSLVQYDRLYVPKIIQELTESKITKQLKKFN